ncbi:MAG: DUF11 domain-containing protein, partial [Planctomycetes bacterium]|nr:DUF11 domain-containing protein [Planctomycetota bacterium]
MIATTVAAQEVRLLDNAYSADVNTVIVCDSLFIQAVDADSNSTPAAIDSMIVLVFDDNSQDSVSVYLYETGANTNTFRVAIATAYGNAVPGDQILQLNQTAPIGGNSQIRAEYDSGNTFDTANVYYPELEFAFIDGLAAVSSCSNDDITVIIRNTGDGPTYGISLRASLPDGNYSYTVGTTGIVNDNGLSDFTDLYVSGADPVFWNAANDTTPLFNLAANDSLTFTFSIDSGCSDSTTLSLIGYYKYSPCAPAVNDSVTGAGPDGVYEYSVNLNRGSMSISKEAIAINGASITPTTTPDAAPGDTVSYLVEVGNTSTGTIYNISVYDSMNVGMDFVSARPAEDAQIGFDPDVIEWPVVDSLLAGAIIRDTIDVQVVCTGDLQNMAYAIWGCAVHVPCDPRVETDTTSVNVQDNLAALEFTFVGGMADINSCRNDTLTVIMYNYGTGPAHGVSLRAAMPDAEYSYVSGSTSIINSNGLSDLTETYVSGTDPVFWNENNTNLPLFTLNPEDSLSFQFEVNTGCSDLTTVALMGFYKYSSCAAAIEDSVTGSGVDDVFNLSVDLNRGALNITKVAVARNGIPITHTTVPDAALGDTVSYMVEVENLSLGTIYNVSVYDSMNVGLDYVAARPNYDTWHNDDPDVMEWASVDSVLMNGIIRDTVDVAVVGCQNLENVTYAIWGCAVHAACDPREVATTSINLQFAVPNIAFSPQDIDVSYCDAPDTITFDVVNSQDAYADSVYLYMDSFPPEFTISPIAGIVAYQISPQRFELLDIPGL